jgi:hypothetical protein
MTVKLKVSNVSSATSFSSKIFRVPAVGLKSPIVATTLPVVTESPVVLVLLVFDSPPIVMTGRSALNKGVFHLRLTVKVLSWHGYWLL